MAKKKGGREEEKRVRRHDRRPRTQVFGASFVLTLKIHFLKSDLCPCFRCLSKGHYGRNCQKTTIKCSSCGEAHHTLHGSDRQFPKKIGNFKILLVRAPSKSLRPVSLAIVPVMILEGDVSVKSFALLDPGSEATIMSRALANTLKLSGPKLKIRFGNFNSSVILDSEVVKYTIKSSSNVIIQASDVFD